MIFQLNSNDGNNNNNDDHDHGRIPMNKYEYYSRILDGLLAENLYRRLRDVKIIDSSRAIVDGKHVILLCSNDYLGLSSNRYVKESLLSYINESCISQCSSRLIAGNDPVLEELEHSLSEHKLMDDALVYTNGYMANLGLASIMDGSTVVYSDELNHASIIDACRLSKAEVRVFRHNDIDMLRDMLREDTNHKNRIIITEGIFSMDGDIAELRELSRLSDEYNTILVVDEAHSDFIYGDNYRGMVEHLDASADIIVSSLSKSLGCFGGYTASNRCIIEYLINKARAFIYTSALPTILAYASLKALEIVKQGTMQRMLSQNVRYFKDSLLSIGFDVASDTHIIPVVIGDEKDTLEFASLLLERGVYAQAVRYPTVPRGKARIRVTLTALHSRDDLEHAVEAFKYAGEELALI